jgi:hypothetical protein
MKRASLAAVVGGGTPYVANKLTSQAATTEEEAHGRLRAGTQQR